ncbi:flagellar biosynthesis protein FlhB [Maricaulis sp.]|uniref:flagellar biosynthesis protein FlhB n=1 Tax=Maricaulis sp. TaxID=1486257 RepID=UPI0026267B5B|nr:flagellar biosynthesis protein FlhB [Maricaulis sp.]
MAEGEDESQKTEEPTQKRLEDARKKGDVAKSQEIPGWFILMSALLLLAFIFPAVARRMAGSMQIFFGEAHMLAVEPQAMMGTMQETIWMIAALVGFPVLVLVVAGFAGHYVQQGMLFTTEKIQPKLSKINPIDGFKRVFGMEAIANFLKGVGKMALVALAAFIVIFPKKDVLSGMPFLDVTAILPIVQQAAIELLIACLAVYAVIAALDYMYQRQTFIKRNRMSRREVKDELKQSEGDPMVRAKLRQIRQERAQKRMMTKVPDATVIVTNPTHYAVALFYEQGETPAPICVAKGVDAVALRIRELGKENDVPIVEDPPLARALHATAELDEEIPVDHFKAVARVIGYVLSLSGGNSRAQYRPSE